MPRSLIISSILFLSSCASVKPLLPEVPKEDMGQKIFFYRMESYPFGERGIASIAVGDSTDSLSFSRGWGVTILPFTEPGVLLHFGDDGSVNPTVSPTGAFVAIRREKVRIFDVKLSGRERDFSIYDVRKHDFVLDLTTKVPYPEFKDQFYEVPWSMIDSSFFIVTSDTIQRYYPDGTHHAFAYYDGLMSFSVSPSERTILVAKKDRVSLYHVATSAITEVKDIGKFLGQAAYVRGVAWSRDENLVAFSDGWTINVYDIARQKLSEYKADGKVFAIEWLSNNALVYVEGEYPADITITDTRKLFRICKLSLDTKEKIDLHERLNHEPFSVRPKLSPSGKLLLFSEKEVNGAYQVKLMSLDGQFMNTICDGMNPVWGR